MTDNSAQDTGNVTTEEADTGLLQRVVALLRLAQELVDLLDGLLETGELGHRVGNLSTPERVQTLVQTRDALLGNNLTPSLTQSMSEGRQGGLHTDLDCLIRAECQIRNELGRGTGTQVDQGPVRAREQPVTVPVLENLIESILPSTLERVADECRGPTEEDSPDSFLCKDRAPCGHVGLVNARVDLTTALDQVKRGDGSMRGTWAISKGVLINANCILC